MVVYFSNELDGIGFICLGRGKVNKVFCLKGKVGFLRCDLASFLYKVSVGVEVLERV